MECKFYLEALWVWEFSPWIYSNLSSLNKPFALTLFHPWDRVADWDDDYSGDDFSGALAGSEWTHRAADWDDDYSGDDFSGALAGSEWTHRAAAGYAVAHQRCWHWGEQKHWLYNLSLVKANTRGAEVLARCSWITLKITHTNITAYLDVVNSNNAIIASHHQKHLSLTRLLCEI